MRRLPLLLAALAALVVAGSASAAPQREVAHSGAWRAVFAYERSTNGPLPYSHLRLTVVDGGRTLLDAPVRSSLRGFSSLGPGGFAGHPSLVFRDLDGDGRPELLLSLFSGGAHCCFLEQVFDFSGSRVRKTELDLADAGERLLTVRGTPLLRSADETFAYAFTDYAESGAPIVLWRYRDGRFADVTRSYPKLVAADAATWWRAYRAQAKRKADVRGVLAPWAADEALLGRAATARRTLQRLAAAGRLEVASIGGPTGTAYVNALWRLLGRAHYLR